MKTRIIILGAIAVMVVTTSAVFAALLFTQTFPPVTRTSGLVANCTTLTVVGTVPPVGTTGFILFECSGGASAFTTPSNTLAAATPTFTLPTGYTSLAFVQVSLSCPGNSNNMVSGVQLNIGGPADYDYCAQVDASTVQLATFDVSWAS